MPGIVTVAVGAPQYGQFAYNLAKTIRRVDKDIPIQVICSDKNADWPHSLSHLTATQMAVFDIITVAEPEDYTWANHKVEFTKTKTCIYDMAAFDECLFLDADTIWISNTTPTQWLKSLSEYELAFQYFARVDVNSEDITNHWIDRKEIVQAYKQELSMLANPKMYYLFSTLLWFKKNAANELFFNTAKTVYETLKTGRPKWADGIPDELAFDIATALCGVEIKTGPDWRPVYWYIGERVDISTIKSRGHVMLTPTGHATDRRIEYIYNKFCKASGSIFPWTDKHKFSKHRQTG